MVSRLEVFDPASQSWLLERDLEAGGMGTFIHNSPDGEKDFYFVRCQERDEKTVLYKVPEKDMVVKKDGSIEVASGGLNGESRVVAEIYPKGPAFMMNVRETGAEFGCLVRISHK